LVVVTGVRRKSLNLRVPPELKARVEEYAAQAGISINAAACVLLAEGLRAEERRRKR
jgi:predicted HicB family RNase H-like nuclease